MNDGAKQMPVWRQLGRAKLAWIVLLIPLEIACWALSSLWGYLLLSLLLLGWVHLTADFEPYTLSELALWFDGLESRSKASLGAAVITVVGFLVAFQSGYKNSRLQRQMDKEVEAADAISAHYRELADLARDLYVFAGEVRSAHEKAIADPDSIDFNADYLLRRLPDMAERQERLISLAVASNALTGRWSIVVLRHIGMPRQLDRLAALSNALSRASWFLPSASLATRKLTSEELLEYFDTASANKFVDAYNHFQSKVEWPLNRVRSQLYSKISSDNLWVWLNGLLLVFEKEKIDDDERRD